MRMQLEAGDPDVQSGHPGGVGTVPREWCPGCPDGLPAGWTESGQLDSAGQQVSRDQIQFITDDVEVVTAMAGLTREAGLPLGVFLDFDCGMGRTGLGSAEAALRLTRKIAEASHLRFAGVHAYDGHLRAHAVEERESAWSAVMENVQALVETLEGGGLEVEAVVGGGSPTFGFYASRRVGNAAPAPPSSGTAATVRPFPISPSNRRLWCSLGLSASPEPTVSASIWATRPWPRRDPLLIACTFLDWKKPDPSNTAKSISWWRSKTAIASKLARPSWDCRIIFVPPWHCIRRPRSFRMAKPLGRPGPVTARDRRLTL